MANIQSIGSRLGSVSDAAGGTWRSLRSEPTFPAVVGRDYGSYAMPSLIVSNSEFADLLLPLMASISV